MRLLTVTGRRILGADAEEVAAEVTVTAAADTEAAAEATRAAAADATAGIATAADVMAEIATAAATATEDTGTDSHYSQPNVDCGVIELCTFPTSGDW